MKDLQKLYRNVFARGSGPRVLADLMDFAGLWDNRFLEDARKADRVAGQKDVVLYILEQIGISDDYEAIARALIKIPVRPKEKPQEEADGVYGD